MKSSSNHGLSEGKEYALKLGSSFQNGARANESYHVLRYDFKPASIDTSQPAELKVGSNKECVVTYPNHDQGSTTYKGGRKPCTKECILVIDKATGEITLERISSNIPLKKSRTGTIDRSGDIRKASNPTFPSKSKSKQSKSTESASGSSSNHGIASAPSSAESSQTPSTGSSQSSSQSKQNGLAMKSQSSKVNEQLKPKDTSGSSSSDSSSDSDSSDSDSDVEEHAKTLDSFNDISTPYDPPPPASSNDSNLQQTQQSSSGGKSSNILQDLQLSDSNSDSD